MKRFCHVCISALLFFTLLLNGPLDPAVVRAAETEADPFPVTEQQAPIPVTEKQQDPLPVTEQQTDPLAVTGQQPDPSDAPSETASSETGPENSGDSSGKENPETAGDDGGAGREQSEALETAGEEEQKDASPAPADDGRMEPETGEESEEETEDPMLRDPIFGLLVGEQRTFPMGYISLASSPSAAASSAARAEAEPGDGLEQMELSERRSAASGVTVKVTDLYYYGDVGYSDGSGQGTHRYTVTFNGQTAVAYCLQPSKGNPAESDKYTIQKLDDGKKLSKVIYYATASAADGGYFALKHPGYSAEKKFIITHLAAAKANGSSDWSHGINSDGKSAVQALIDYVDSMPDLPGSSVSITPASTGASEQGDVLMSDPFTLSAGCTVTAALPAGVTLSNQTDPSRSASGTATLKDGDVFRLSLAKPAFSGTSVSVTATGSAVRDYSAYKIKTDRDTQDLGLVFAEGTPVQEQAVISVTFTPAVTVSALKTDGETQHALQGAVFGLFAGVNMREADGTARTAGQLLQQAETGADGKAVFSYQLTTDASYYVQEIKAPAGYIRNQSDRLDFSFRVGSSSLTPQSYSKSFPDKPVKGEISMIKMDRELYEKAGQESAGEESPEEDKGAAYGKAQGDAVLEGAVYGLYAREDIVRPDQSGTVLYSAGDLVAQGTTDENGEILWKDLWLGKYRVQEISPSKGYVLDETSYPVDLVYADDMTELVRAQIIVTEQVIKQPFQLIKAAKNENTDAPLLEGAGFSAWLVSSLKKAENEEGYDTDGADPVPLCADGSAELFTDGKGYACSIPIPYGTYLVKETTTPENYSPVKPFLVTVSEHLPDKPQVWRILLDEEYSANLKVIKKDSKTGCTVLKAGTQFRIYSVDEDKYVEQVTTYPSSKVHSTFTTDETGTLMLPSPLRPGTYRLEETVPPQGYMRSTEGMTIAVDETQAVLQDPVSGDLILETVVEDTPVTGRLELIKKGPMLTGYEKGKFIYEVRGLAGAVFEVTAKEDIPRPDAQTDASGKPILLYRKGQRAAELKTDANGEASVDGLPLGKYQVMETAAPYGCALIRTPFEVELTSGDGSSAVVTKHLEVTDPKQKVEVAVLKQSAGKDSMPLAGAEFTLYAAEDIRACSSDGAGAGPVLVSAGEAVAKAVSKKNGNAVFEQELPNARYYLKETKAPDGYQISKKKVEVDASWKSGEKQALAIGKKVSDKPLTGRGQAVAGAAVQGGVPRTGDAAPIALLLSCALGSLALILFLLRRRLRLR